MPLATALVALAAVLPALAAATVGPVVDRRLVLTPGHMCGTQGRYAPGSAYEANLRRLAATVAAEVNASPCNCSAGTVAGRRPDQVTASVYCYWRAGASSSDCGACVALAFREAQRLCPYHRQAVAVVDGGACSVSFLDAQRREQKLGKVHDGDVTFIFHSGYAWFWWISYGWSLLNPDVLLILLFQAAGLGCVVFLFLQEWRTQ
ncbi:hypothetical protein BAE44_0009510 [Dichanthelium oligosanthes]|uniref:Gnk2-homologous domain-containing protein n=1 Tax=Dichanthelium oligosanthes TaxID=888268 RepID=A0A1E5VWI3_9POAL|nr:hypothetical protein BAE44_0009510 [Dichanthelium oligosanthes]